MQKEKVQAILVIVLSVLLLAVTVIAVTYIIQNNRESGTKDSGSDVLSQNNPTPTPSLTPTPTPMQTPTPTPTPTPTEHLSEFKSTLYNVTFKYPVEFGEAKATSYDISGTTSAKPSELVSFANAQNFTVKYPYWPMGWTPDSPVPICERYVSQGLGEVSICHDPITVETEYYGAYIIKGVGGSNIFINTSLVDSQEKYNQQVEYLKRIVDNFAVQF